MTRIRKIGVDEVGRGPLAGPVTVCAFSLIKGSLPKGINDSKRLSRDKREELSKKLHQLRGEGKVYFKICSVSAREIDKKGIAGAIRLALRNCLSGVDSKTEVFLDGSLKAPERFKKQKTIKGGDGKNKLIGAASIVAKVHRDSLMKRYSSKYPQYGFDVHMGYGTVRHRRVIKKMGLCKEHRKCFTLT